MGPHEHDELADCYRRINDLEAEVERLREHLAGLEDHAGRQVEAFQEMKSRLQHKCAGLQDRITELEAAVERLRKVRDAAEAFLICVDEFSNGSYGETQDVLRAALDAAKEAGDELV